LLHECGINPFCGVDWAEEVWESSKVREKVRMSTEQTGGRDGMALLRKTNRDRIRSRQSDGKMEL
jgi:hypothetical protein